MASIPRLSSMIVAASVLLVTVTGPAGAQAVSPVAAGSSVDVSNGTECVPNTDVKLFFEPEGGEPVELGSSLSDAAGHFDTSVVIPADAPTGNASVVVECGLDGAVLTYRLAVTGAVGSSGTSIVQIAAVVLAIVALGALIVGLRRRSAERGKVDGGEAGPDAAPDPAAEPVIVGSVAPVAPALTLEAAPMPMPAAALAGPAVATDAPVAPIAMPSAGSADAGSDTPSDDDADYWFWETTTPAGPVRRIACMTEKTFHLHEVPADRFQALLDRIVADGPDETLSGAFVRIPVAAIAQVRHAGTTVHIDHTNPQGRATRTVDLGAEFTAVLDIIARRVPAVPIGAAPTVAR